LTCSDVEISVSTPSTIFAATTHGVLRSADGGTSWSRGDGIEDAETFAVAIDPTQPAKFLAALAVHVYRTADGGATRALSDAGLSSFSTRWIATDLHDDSVIYAAGPAGLARSADHSRSWTISTAITPVRVAVDANASTLYAASGNTVHRSVDSGVTWTAFSNGLPGVAPQFLAADPQISGTLNAVVNGAVYKMAGDSAWVSRNGGLPGSLDYVAIDPHDSSTLYAGGPDGVFKSNDGGLSWVQRTTD
jgi:photosystem II stability/assembly factor-like uncharacterized protein